MTVADLKINECARVAKINLNDDAKRHLMDIGMTKGTELIVKKIAPLGDPIEISIRGSVFSISLNDAKLIDVEE